MRRYRPNFYTLSFALHAFLLFAIYEMGCPRAIVRSEPMGVTVQVVNGANSASSLPVASGRIAKAVGKLSPVAAATSMAGNTEQPATKAALEVGKASGLEVAAKERYLYELRLILDARKEYPAVAKSLRQEGSVEVGFLLRPDGKIEEAGIVAPSNHPSLNRAAMQLVEAVGKFKPLPAELGKTVGWRVSVPIEYRLR